MKDKNLIFHQNFQQFNQVRIVNYDINNQANKGNQFEDKEKGLRFNGRQSVGYDKIKTPKTQGAKGAREFR